MKRTILITLFIILAFALTVVSFAEEGTPGETIITMTSTAGEEIDNDLGFYMYTEKLLGFSVPAFYRVSHGFTGDLLEFYNALSACIREVAAGTRTSTVFRVEKGLFFSQEEFDALINALIVDHPYEMYWYDKTRGVGASGTYSWTEFQFYVAEDYAAGDFSTNPSKVKKVQTAVSTAKSIVSKYASHSDGDKLMGYKNEICSLVSYNQATADDPYAAYGDAYQLVWVFDGDASTNVVCEGYSKAFQYLCDMTDFSSDIVCITVSGVMSDAYSSGGHMWNIVKMADGYNYLVDVTNCDSGTAGYPDKLFLAKYTSGSVEEGYIFDLGYSQLFYVYYSNMFSIYGEKRLTLMPKGHLVVIDPAVEATCTGDGLTEGSHCEICGEVFVRQEVVPSPGHIAGTDAAVDATCTSTGLTEGSHCTVCGEILIPQEIILAKGHEIVIDKAVEATCTETGLTEGRYCSVCKEVLLKQEIVPAAGHQIVVDAAAAPSCGKEGLTEGSHCGVCNAVITAQEVLPPLDHSPVVDPEVKPTCTKPGLTKGTHCKNCGEVIKAQEVIPEIGHWTETDAAVEPTCTVYGLTEGSHCVRCFEILVAQEILDPLGHDSVTDEAVPASCTKDGLTEGSHCSRCNEIFVKQEIVNAFGHTEKSVPGKTATCTETGLTGGIKCSVCGEMIKAQEEIPALGHDEGAWVVVTEATNDTDGLKELRCTVCETVLETEVIPPKLEEDKPTRLPGDVSGDGIIDGRDLLRLAKYIGGFEVEIVLENASVNGDDVVDGRDLLRLAKYIGGFEVDLE